MADYFAPINVSQRSLISLLIICTKWLLRYSRPHHKPQSPCLRAVAIEECFMTRFTTRGVLQLDGLNSSEIATVEAAEGGHGPIGAETSVGNAAACSRRGAIEATS